MAKPRSNTYAKACKTKVSFFSAATYHQHLYQKNILNARIKSHIDYASIVWDGCGEVHLKTSELPASKGRQMNSSLSFPVYRSKDECNWNFTSCNRSITQNHTHTKKKKKKNNTHTQKTQKNTKKKKRKKKKGWGGGGRGIFMHTVLNNNSPNYLHNSLLVTSPTH